MSHTKEPWYLHFHGKASCNNLGHHITNSKDDSEDADRKLIV